MLTTLSLDKLLPSLYPPSPFALITTRPELPPSHRIPSILQSFQTNNIMLTYLSRLIGIRQTVVFQTIFLIAPFNSLPSDRAQVSISHWPKPMPIEGCCIKRWRWVASFILFTLREHSDRWLHVIDTPSKLWKHSKVGRDDVDQGHVLGGHWGGDSGGIFRINLISSQLDILIEQYQVAMEQWPFRMV